MTKLAIRRLTLFALTLVLTGCGIITFEPTPVGQLPTAAAPVGQVPTFNPGGPMFPNPTQVTGAPTAIGVQPTRMPVSSDGWLIVNQAMEYRTVQFRNSAGVTVDVMAVRLDPTRVSFRVFYTPGQVRTIQQWAQALPGVQTVINANFYDQQFRALGLVAADGILTGFSGLRQQRDDGMFQVKGGIPSVRSMFLQPYQSGEFFDQAVHAFPMLMAMGQVAPIMPDLSTQPDRRTVIAQDRNGKIIFLTTTNTTYKEMGQFLSLSGFNINFAVAMDGGNSSGLYVATGGAGTIFAGARGTVVVLSVFLR